MNRNNIRTVSFTYAELEAIKIALSYALTNPYNALDTERNMRSARAAVTEALKRPNIEDFYAALAEEEAGNCCGSCIYFTPYDDGNPDGRCRLGMGTYSTHTLGSEPACSDYRKENQQ